jgi:hypothetical protein
MKMQMHCAITALIANGAKLSALGPRQQKQNPALGKYVRLPLAPKPRAQINKGAVKRPHLICFLGFLFYTLRSYFKMLLIFLNRGSSIYFGREKSKSSLKVHET